MKKLVLSMYIVFLIGLNMQSQTNDFIDTASVVVLKKNIYKTTTFDTDNIYWRHYRGQGLINTGKFMFFTGFAITSIGVGMALLDEPTKATNITIAVGSASMFISIPIWLIGLGKKQDYHTHKIKIGIK